MLLRRSTSYTKLGMRYATDSAKIKPNDATIVTARRFNEIPGPLSLPFIKSTWMFLPGIGKLNPQKLEEAHWTLYKQFGKIVRLDFFGVSQAVWLFDHKDFETVFANEGKYPERFVFPQIEVYRKSKPEIYESLGLMASQGEEWLSLRRKLQKHMMKPKNNMVYIPAIDKVSSDFIDRLNDIKNERNEISDLLSEFSKWALESTAVVTLNIRLGGFQPNLPPDSEPSRMIRAVQQWFTVMNAMLVKLPLWKIYPTKLWKQFIEAQSCLEEISLKHIHVMLNQVKAGEIDPDKDPTIMESMLAAKDIPLKEIIVMIMDSLFAGIDTTSHGAIFCLYHLARNPEKQNILYEEIKKLLPNKESEITPQIFNQLRYLKACLKESSRLTPVAGGTSRVVQSDCTLSGYHIPAGTMALMSNIIACRLEENFPDPDKFIPERWLREDKSYSFNKFASLPFSFGPRMCIGRRLAELEMQILLVKIFQNFKVEHFGNELSLITRLLNTPEKPLSFRLINRD